MSMRTITESEALAFSGEEDSLPYRILTVAGQQAVAQWVHAVARDPESHSLSYWHDRAEDAAGNARPGEAVIIEMRGADTRSGNPETLTVHPELLSWQVSE